MTRVLRLLAALVLLPGALALTPIAAFAGEADATGATETPAPTERAPTSRRHAVLLALGGTVVPVAAGMALGSNAADEGTRRFGHALAITGIVVGPSTGHFSAGCPGRGVLGIAIRGGTLLAAVAVLRGVEKDPDTEEEFFAGLFEILGVAAVAGIVVTTSAIVDIATAGNCRRGARDRTGAAGAVRFQFVPIAGSAGPGVALRATF